MASDAEVRADEWQVLQSIYPEFMPADQPKDDDPFVLQVPVQLSEPFPVHIVSEDPDASQIVTLSHLPSILLSLILPPTYPSQQPPTIHSVRPTHAWLPPPLVEHLTQILLDLWKNECILGAWIEHIQNGDELLSSLNLIDSSTKSVRLPNSSPRLLSPLLVAHNTAVLETHFQEATHTCPICLTRLLGTQCIALTPCSHVACRACLEKFWGSCIVEGDVARVGCPDPQCVQDARPAAAADVAAVVPPEMAERWQWLLRKQETERDPTITHCPVVACQQPVRPPPPGAAPSEWDRLRICACGFSFCVYCRRAWHGPHTLCAMVLAAGIVQAYLKHPEGSPERKVMEQRYGRNNVLKIIAQYEEDKANRKWMNDETMACPGCKIRVQKAMGCNHMMCTKCRQHFCYRCGTRLDPARPYAHFNTPGLQCYYKLFDTQDQREDWEPMPDDPEAFPLG